MKEYNFMWQLKNHSMIDHNVVSFYMKEETGNVSSIKFGSYDKEAIADGASMAVYKSNGLDRWGVKMNNFKINGH
jgi:hypothetical protein